MSSEMIEEGDFDVEAQEALLGREAEAGAVLPEAEATSNGAREALHRIILVIRSIEHFKLGATKAADHHTSSSRPASSDYTAIGISDDHIAQDSGSVTAQGEILVSPGHSVAENENDINIQSAAQTKSIREIVKEQNLEDLRKFGGVAGVAHALNSHLENGLPNLDPNTCQQKSCQISQVLSNILNCFSVACNNYTVFLLSIAAVLSLIFGVKEQGFPSGWFINGAIILFTVVALVICSTIHNFVQEWRSLKNSWWLKGRMPKVSVVRDGHLLLIPECSLLVGDIAVLQKGSQVPADGVFIDGQALKLDKRETIDENKPFLLYGSRVINGNGRMMVTSTGVDTAWGENMSRAIGYSPDKKSKLEACLHKLTACVHIMALLISILIIIVVFLRYNKQGWYKSDPKGEPTKVETILDCIKGIINGSKLTARVLTTLSVSLLVIMEGMPFVISFAIFVWNRKTLGNKASRRDFLAFARFASLTMICSDKFGGLSEHELEVNNFFVGGEFVSESSVVGSNVLEGLCDGIGTMLLIIGRESKFDPLISWAEEKLGLEVESLREQYEVKSSEGGDPFKERCQMQMEKTSNGEKKKYLHYNGPAKDVLSLCSHYYDIEGKMQEFDDLERGKFEQAMEQIAAADGGEVAYARELCVDETDVVSLETNSIIFMGMISLKNIKWSDTRIAISTLKQGGITTILASGDDVEVLKTIGERSGIFVPGSDDLALTADEFKSWTNEEKSDKLKRIRVIGNCLPFDKILLIEFLREKGEVVAFLGQRTIDAPALKQADIGLAFGTWSSELVRESADIIIGNGDFSLLLNLVKNSRCSQENLQKFIQLEMIIAISSSLISFLGTVLLGDAPITAVRLLLLNLLVAVVGGLALLTGPATEEQMKMPPVKSSAELITKAMWRNIAVQAIYQTSMCVTLQYKGHAVPGASRDHIKSLIYNAFFMCQMFIMFVVREPERKNIFRRLFCKNWWFWVAIVLFIICQAVVAVVEAAVSSSSELSLKLWVVCLLIALIPWLLDLAAKCVFALVVRGPAGQA